MEESLFQELGLSNYESKIYFALLSLGEASSGQILEKAKIQAGRIYQILSSLKEKGLVSQITRNNRKIFIANSQNALMNLVEDKQKNLDDTKTQLISFLSKADKKEGPTSEEGYKYFEGIPAIKAMWSEIIDYLPKMDKTQPVLIHASRAGTFENLIGYFNEFTKARVRLKINYKLILSAESKWHGEKRKKQLSEVKYLVLNNEVQWGVIGDYYLQFYATGKIPKGFLIKDKKFAETYRQVFNELWKLAKK